MEVRLFINRKTASVLSACLHSYIHYLVQIDIFTHERQIVYQSSSTVYLHLICILFMFRFSIGNMIYNKIKINCT